MEISAAQFKAQCLKLMHRVEKTRETIVITKRGRAVAQLAPARAHGDSLFGYMKDSLKVEGDVMAPLDEEWSAMSGEEDRLYASSKKPARLSKRQVSVFIHGPAMRRSWILAQVSKPVRPRPPMVAANHSGFSVDVQSNRLPSERSSSKAST